MPLARLNWKRAMGEVALIVVGVLIALAASDWQGGVVQRRNELSLLAEIQTSLSADVALLETGRERYERLQSRLEVLLPYLQSNHPYSDSLDTYFGSVYGGGQIQLNRAAYESLRSQGIQIVSDQALRSQIARVYEQTYASVESSLDTERDVNLNVLRPFFLVHFRDLRFGQSATPVDFESLREGVEFANLVSYRLQVIRQNHIPRFEGAISEIRGLIDALEQELATH